MLSHFICVPFYEAPWTVARLLCPWDSPGKNTEVGYHALLQGMFPTQGSLMSPALTGRSFITSTTWEAQKHFFICSFQNYSSIFCPLKFLKIQFSVQFSSVAQSCLTLCDTMNRSMLGLPVHHQLLESTQTHVH